MKIFVNGEEKEIDDLLNLQEVVRLFSSNHQSAIVEVNGEIVPGEPRKKHKLKPGDRLELIQLVGGG